MDADSSSASFLKELKHEIDQLESEKKRLIEEDRALDLAEENNLLYKTEQLSQILRDERRRIADSHELFVYNEIESLHKEKNLLEQQLLAQNSSLTHVMQKLDETRDLAVQIRIGLLLEEENNKCSIRLLRRRVEELATQHLYEPDQQEIVDEVKAQVASKWEKILECTKHNIFSHIV